METVADAVRDDPAGTYADAANEVLEAFWAAADDAQFALPEFGDYQLPADVPTAVLPLVLAVPDGEVRDLESIRFDRAIESVGGAGDFDRILRHLGRRPDFTNREAFGTASR